RAGRKRGRATPQTFERCEAETVGEPVSTPRLPTVVSKEAAAAIRYAPSVDSEFDHWRGRHSGDGAPTDKRLGEDPGPGPKDVLLAIDWLAVRVGDHDTAINNAVVADGDFARKCSLRGSDLDRHLFNFVGHMRPSAGYSMGRRNLSCAAFVLA